MSARNVPLQSVTIYNYPHQVPAHRRRAARAHRSADEALLTAMLGTAPTPSGAPDVAAGDDEDEGTDA